MHTVQLGMSGFIVFVMVVIWAATGFGDFWPVWVWFGLSIPVAVQYAIRRAVRGPREWRALSIHAALSCVAGSLMAIATFTITLTFMFSTPGWEASLGGFPALSVAPGQFILKDAVLLGASVWSLGEALRQAARPA